MRWANATGQDQMKEQSGQFCKELGLLACSGLNSKGTNTAGHICHGPPTCFAAKVLCDDSSKVVVHLL